MVKYNFNKGLCSSRIKMATPLSQTELAIMSWSDAQFNNWQSLAPVGKKISALSLVITVDENGRRSYDVDVTYAENTTQAASISPPTGR